MFVIAFVLALFCLSLLAVLRAHWKTRQPVPQKSITGQASGLLFGTKTESSSAEILSSAQA
jgi:hypothetical protein